MTYPTSTMYEVGDGGGGGEAVERDEKDIEPTSLVQPQQNGYTHYDLLDAEDLPYRHICYLGEGQTAKVDKVVARGTDIVYARKAWHIKPRSPGLPTSVIKQEFEKEMLITRRLAGWRGHFVHVECSYNTPRELGLIMSPAADGGTLIAYLDHYHSTSVQNDTAVRNGMQRVLYNAFGCLASGLAYMHTHRIRHRDIKPQNILVHQDVVLYADFGVARDYSSAVQTVTEDYPGPFTRKYCAPEVSGYAAGDTRSWKSDVFSLGCVFLYMYATLVSDPTLSSIVQCRFYEQTDRIQSILQSFEHAREVVQCMRGMLQYDQHHRPTADEVVRALQTCEGEYFCSRCCAHSSTTSSISPDEQPAMRYEFEEHSGFPDYTRSHDFVLSLLMERSQLEREKWLETKGFRHFLGVPRRRRKRGNGKQAGEAITKYGVVPTMTDRLSHYGIRRYTITHTVRTNKHLAKESDGLLRSKHPSRTLYVDDVYEWVSGSLLGLGIQMIKRKPYGRFYHSLRVFPAVPYFEGEIFELMEYGSVTEMQSLFQSGALHPYVQTTYGYNLLTLAIHNVRIDMIALLSAHGVPVPEEHSSLLDRACVVETWLETSQAIEFFRVLLQIPQLEIAFYPSAMWSHYTKTWSSDVVAWLFHNAPSYDGVDEASLHEFCLRATLRRLPLTLFRDGVEAAQSELMKYLTPADIQFRIRSNSISLVDDLYPEAQELWRSDSGLDAEYLGDTEEYIRERLIAKDLCWIIGSIWLSVLEQFGIDIPSWLMYELSLHPFHMLNNSYSYQCVDDFMLHLSSRRILVGRIDSSRKDRSGFGDTNMKAYASPKGGYLLGWKYAPEVGGELLFEEIKAMVVQVELDGGGWPIFDDDEEEVQRKKRDRQKRKEIRAGIPGSWVEASDVC